MRQEALELLREARQAPPFVIVDEHLKGLPKTVQRYLRSAGIVDKETIRTVRLKQKGVLRLKEGQKWLPFVAEQYFTTCRPAFIWHARVRSFPWVTISVTDMFARGHGRLTAKFLSLIRLADANGPEVDQGELLRYLAETIWFPTAWLSDYIQWDSIDGSPARATLTFAGLTVAAAFRFSGGGELDEIAAERYREENGKFALRRWSGRVEDYREMGGIRIPTRVEVSWYLDSGEFACFRAEITEIEYNI